MAEDDVVGGPGEHRARAPEAPSEETIARLRTRAEQLRAARDLHRSGEAAPAETAPAAPPAPGPVAKAGADPMGVGEAGHLDDDDPFEGFADDPETSALLDRWTDAPPDESVEPRRNWSNVVAVAAVAVVAALAFIGARALIAGSEDDTPSGGPAGSAAADDGSVLDEQSPSLDELTSDVTLPPGPEEGLLVESQGITIVPDRFDPNRREGTFAVVLANPHDGWLAQGVQVTVTFVDEAGAALGTDNGFVDVVLPAQEVAVASLFFDAPTVPVARMDVAVDVARWRETGPYEGGFTITDVQTGEAEFSGVRTLFTIRSDFDEPLVDVGVTAVYRAADGRIIGGYDTFVERLDPGVPTPAEIALLANVDPAAIAATELYPTAAFGSVPDAGGD